MCGPVQLCEAQTIKENAKCDLEPLNCIAGDQHLGRKEGRKEGRKDIKEKKEQRQKSMQKGVTE